MLSADILIGLTAVYYSWPSIAVATSLLFIYKLSILEIFHRI